MPYNPFDRIANTAPTNQGMMPDGQTILSPQYPGTTTGADGDPVALLIKAIVCKHKGVMFHDKASRVAHMWGLQGHKRWHRMQMHEDFCEMTMLRHHLIDMFGADYDIKSDYEVPNLTDFKTLLEEYNKYESTYYGIMSDISNKLTIANYTYEGHIIKEMMGDAVKEIEKTRRWMQDYEKAGWDWKYIRYMDNELHCKMKDKEYYPIEPGKHNPH